jgi:nitroreductase
LPTTPDNPRVSAYPIDPIFLERWSPRAFDENAEISDNELFTLFEAAHWAPSSSNLQPWRFLYARRGTSHWDRFLNLLIPFNQSWAHRASALVIVISKTLAPSRDNSQPAISYTHSFDAGAAWAFLSLQAFRSGWHAHGMAGFDMERAVTELNVPADYRVEAAIAIGRLADKSILSESLQKREVPSLRQELETIIFEGGFAPGETTPV